MVGGAGPPRFEDYRKIREVFAVPGGEGGQPLEPLAVLRNGDFQRVTRFRGRDVPRFVHHEAVGGEIRCRLRGLQLPRLSVSAGQGVGERVEVQTAGERIGDDDFRASHEGQGFRHAVIAPGEVAVEGSDDGVLARLARRLAGQIIPLPLADAGAAGVGQDLAADGLEHRHLPVPFDGRPDLLGAGGDQ